MAVNAEKLKKELQVKEGIVKRYIQEIKCYEKEVEKQNEKIDVMTKQASPDSADEQYAIKKANEVLQETKMMIPMTLGNLKQAVQKLENFIAENDSTLKENNVDLTVSNEFIHTVTTSY